jgi:hypothetical protein
MTMLRQRHNQVMVLFTLPDVILDIVTDQYLSLFIEIRSISLVCSEGAAAAKRIQFSEGAQTFQTELKQSNPYLYECMVWYDDRRSSWKARFFRLKQLKKEANIESFVPCELFLTANQDMKSTCFDMLFYSHPICGFQLQIGVIDEVVVLYGIRIHEMFQKNSEGFPVLKTSHTHTVLKNFNLIFFKRNISSYRGNFKNMLVLCSVNGRATSTYDNLYAITADIRSGSELCRMRLMYFPNPSRLEERLSRVPIDYRLNRSNTRL